MSDLQDYLNDPARPELVAQVRKKIDELGVDNIYYQYVSITGRIMGKVIPAKHWERVTDTGMQTWLGGVTNVFADKEGDLIGFAPNASELLALPDPDTFCQLPWNKRLARVFCTVFFSREDPERPEEFLDSDTRGNLRRIHKQFGDDHGLQMRVGCEPEMLWLKPGDDKAPYYGTTKPYAYHIDQFEQLSDVWLKVYDYAIAMGLDMIQGDHEDAPGQIELNFQYDDALRTSDRVTTYRQICAQVAREFGLIAVFMSKPYMGMPANGCHHNVSLWSGGDREVASLVDGPQPGMDEVFSYSTGGTNEFRDPREKWMPSDTGKWSLGGMLTHLDALVAIGASTVNSYRRLNDTGMWAPVGRSWGLQNRSCAIRASSPDRFEFRCVDSMVNPYLMQSALLKACSDGLNNKIDPGPPEERNFVDVVNSGEDVSRIPTTLRDALDALAESDVIKSALPGDMYGIYDWYKRDEWNKFIWETSDWDVKTYLDCLP
ncbi:MAG: glutamine synthetase [Rhodospirillales bacterium]|mgnify:FL=1|jgi:glutamine synthetase|nr:glutamine synthetase [Rhodospirillales bacterium]MBT4040431.1 glutamine synthetase [Rhodospirillales bacterium]MBT4628127.1 glutamine synthetase [Rhodospirillales bacterium]MBT5352587.1 glutamine synthetase [Rhodospirillales bacterium]MBT5522078.1 glutamine synthetase [Rhodospirillales bacterium]